MGRLRPDVLAAMSGDGSPGGLSSPSTPATAPAASSSSCGACPASAITAPSSAPQNASATALAGGPGGIDPSLRPASISRAQRLISVREARVISRPTGWS
jgi:hypothetical protein